LLVAELLAAELLAVELLAVELSQLKNKAKYFMKPIQAIISLPVLIKLSYHYHLH